MATSYSLSPYDNVGSGITRSGALKFPNPFFDIASEYVPSEINSIFEWCEFLYLTMGTYRSATRKVVRYFLTEIILTGESEDEREEIQDMLEKQLHMLTELAQIGDDFMTYGNVFISIYFPFDRFMICQECKAQFKDEYVTYKYKADTGKFSGECPKCHHKGEFETQDRRSPDKERVKFIRWNPKQIRLKVHPISGDIEYYWDIPPKFMERIEAGDNFYVRSTPKPILDCLTKASKAKGEGASLFKFNKDAIYHFHETTLAGLPIVGWGIPPILPNFKLAYYIQVLRRYDEAIAMDFIVPFRILYPKVGATPQQDAVLSTNLAEFRGHMLRMVSERRRDPTNVQVAPFEVGYQMIGGEARQIAPKESIKFAVEELLNASGYPAEMYMGNLSLQAAPVALRLFEKTWGSLVDGYNDLLSWTTKRLARHFMWGDIDASLRSVTLADDLERKALQMQAAAGMDVSKSTAYSPFGIDYLEEQQKILDEQVRVQTMQQKAMAESQAQQNQGAGGGGGGEGASPSGPGGQPGETPGDVYSQAQQMADTLLYNTPETLRRGQLMKIKQSNPTLHALVLQFMSEKRTSMRSQGGAAMQQQGQQAMAQGQPPPA